MAHKSLEEASKIIGQKFGRLTILKFTGQSTPGKYKRRIVSCVCDCGKEKVIPVCQILNGRTRSCGCLALEASARNLRAIHKKFYDNGTWEIDPKMASAKKVWQLSYKDEDISFEDFLNLSQQNCYYCNKPPSNCSSAYCKRNTKFRQENGKFIYNGLDRIDNTKGHLKINVVPCCIDCNIAKLDRSQEDFFIWIKNIYNKHFG